MSKFNTIAISRFVALHPKVEIHKILGLFERVCYQPTRSSIQSYCNYYTADEATVLRHIAEGDDPRLALRSAQEIHTTDNGDYRLDLCLSGDCQFAAFQVFERKNNEYIPYSKLCFLEGEEASALENLLA